MKYRLIAFFIFLCFQVFPVFAHGDEPRLEISSERINPGGLIEVRGVDFEFEEKISLALVGDNVEIQLGEFNADTEGVFLQYITIPIDLKEDVYHFLATTDDHEILSPALIVQGSPILDDEVSGQGLRDQEDSLLAPMPTLPPVNSAATTPPSKIPPAKTDTSSLLAVIAITMVVILGLIVLFIWGKMRRN